MRLLPGDPPATRQAVDAIMSADLVVLGPGSWFTSVIPHVLVPELAAALQATTARRALVLNLVAEPGETAGFSVLEQWIRDRRSTWERRLDRLGDLLAE